MEVNVDIDSEKINEMISKAVLESCIGETLKNQIKESMHEINRSYDNPIKKEIKRHITKLDR